MASDSYTEILEDLHVDAMHMHIGSLFFGFFPPLYSLDVFHHMLTEEF